MTGIPKQIGTYLIDGEIGRGGMGVVYKATDSRLGRSVAIKALPPQFEDNPELMARFEREARTLAALNHPNIGGIHGIEDHQGSEVSRSRIHRRRDPGRQDRSRPTFGSEETLEIGSQIATWPGGRP